MSYMTAGKLQAFEALIRNIRAYLLTALYNASLTMDNYYSALVNRDLYGQPKATKSKSYDDNYRYQPGETL